MRHAKAHIRSHQMRAQGPSPLPRSVLPGSFPESAPTDASESNNDGSGTGTPTPTNGRRRILLSNESPILLVSASSIEAIHTSILAFRSDHGRSVAPRTLASSFRGNIVVGARAPPKGAAADAAQAGVEEPAYAEDQWRRVRIGAHHEYAMLGACRRCHMVCIDQETGERSEEPMRTLTLVRRFDGATYFGVHMALADPGSTTGASETGSEGCALEGGGKPRRWKGGRMTAESQSPTVMVGDLVTVLERGEG